MISQELASSWSRIALVVVSSTAMLIGLVAYARVAGLRTFSKMSAFDVAVTVAFGSLLGAVAMSGSSLVEGLVASAVLIFLQALISAGRSRLGWSKVVDNTPLLLMVGPEMIPANLRLARVTEGDIRAKLREANVARRADVLAVILETTGDLSVIHGHTPLDPDLLVDVAGAERYSGRADG